MKKSNDPIIQEIYDARAELLREHGGDYRKYVESVMKRQWETGHKVVSFVPKNKPETYVAEASPPYPSP
jgi:hypothetical protein